MWPPEPGQRGIMGGAEQLPLFDSPVSGMVLAPYQGAKQECNRPDQLRQCRDHCYSDLGFQGLKDKKSWSEPDLSALRCEKVWFKVVGGQL